MKLSFSPFLASDASNKRDRSAFVYFERDENDFAQCSSCSFKLNTTCMILAMKVEPNDSCAMYVPGKKFPESFQRRMTPEEAGFVHGPVRCEHCVSLDGSTCQLFAQLNEQLPDIFHLEIQVKPNGCCNAWSAK